MRPIDIGPADLETVRRILSQHASELEARAFGSRVSWTARATSDLDLVLMTDEPLSIAHMAELKAAFTKSDLPFRVDIVDWASTSKSFREVIERDYVVLAASDGEPFDGSNSGMADGWQTVTVADIAEKVAMGPFGSSIKVNTFVPEGVPVISGQHLHGIRVDDAPGFNFVTPEHAERLANANVRRGDIVFTHAGNIGQVAYIPEDSRFDRYVISQRQFYMRCDRAKAIHEFLAIYFTSPAGQHQLLANASQVGVPSIAQPVTYLRTIEIPLPPLPEQRAIAHVLGTLDDKIELNRRMNETLEAMARALFKSWFVDFDPVRAKAALKRHAAAHAPLEEESAYITPPLRGSRQGKDEVRGRAGGGTHRWGDIKRQYTQQTLQNAKTLRQTQTNAEGLLWHYLRDKQLDGHNFRRQQPIGPYIADFACMSHKLLIELDGGGHTEQKAHDRERDEFLRQRGYRVLRFWNNEVFENCLGVLERVYEALTSPPPRQPIPVGLAAATPPQGGSDWMDEWTLERARAYLDNMGEDIAALFPDSFVDSELGEIPEGWGADNLGNHVEFQNGYAFKSDDWQNKGVPVVKIGSVKPGLVDLSATSYVSPNTVIGLERFKLNPGDILVGMTGYPGETGVVPVHDPHPYLNQRVGRIAAPKDRPENYAWIYAQVRNLSFRKHAEARAHGSAQANVSGRALLEYPVMFPGKALLKHYSDFATPLLSRYIVNDAESRTLAAQRDTLLPKLISGRLCVKEAEKFIGRIV